MATTILVTTVFTPNLNPGSSLNRVLEHLEQTDEGLRSELAQLDEDVQVTTTLLNIADIFEKSKGCAPASGQKVLHQTNGHVAQNGSLHNRNGVLAAAHNGVCNGKPALSPKATEEAGEGTEQPLVLEELLEQIQQGKLELYLHLAPPAPNEQAGKSGRENFEEEEIGEHFLQNPFLY